MRARRKENDGKRERWSTIRKEERRKEKRNEMEISSYYK